jgi:hypothetical protein
MRLRFFFLPFTLVTIFIYSCKKDKELEPISNPTTTYPNFSQLKVGNYWIYKQFHVDANGSTPIFLGMTDSCFIEKDTLINGKTYFKVIKPDIYSFLPTDISFERDSLDCIVNSNGKILFSSEDFSSILETSYFIGGPLLNGGIDTICKIVKQMADKNMEVVTPAGTYITTNVKSTHYMFPDFSTAGSIRYRNKRYAKNIGVVIETLPFFASNPKEEYTERRLVRYHLN